MCEKKCKVQNQVWEEKKHFSIDAYQVNSDPHDIMAEVYKNGPVEVSFIIYEVTSIQYLMFDMCFAKAVKMSQNFW